MTRAIGIGNQDFEVIREKGYFYIDKTKFIREWWERRQCDSDYTPEAFWKDAEYEYGGEVFFREIRRQERAF